ncbi:MAG: DUF4215 domain-containing protein [Nannocystaceae bacterium]
MPWTKTPRSALRPLSAGLVGLALACASPPSADTDATTDAETGGRCGDGVVDDGESCDDGNADGDDGCSDSCQLETCGDGVVQAAEECDDGNNDPEDGCDDACRRPPSPPACGDGVVDDGEACDDGNTDDDDGCSGACELESCGDGVVDEGEACDDGAETATCDADCTLATCGDGHTNAAAGEECDDGNLINGDRCNNSCERNTCGDGVVDADEECDDGAETATCDADCTLAACGDGYTNAAAGEACDDGNAVDDDMCSLSCTIPVCDGGDDPGPCGAHLWSKRFGEGGEQYAEAVAADAQGDVVVTGSFQAWMDMGGGVLASQGDDDLFVAKFSGGGEHLWSRGFGDGAEQIGRAVAVDSAGNVVLTGDFHGTMNLGGDDLVSQGHSDLFVAKLSPAGEHLWSRSFGDGEFQLGRAVAVDGDDNVIITGNLWGAMDLGGGDLVSQDNDLFVAKFSPAGAHLWSQIFGDSAAQIGKAVAAGPQGDIILAGNLQGSIDLGGGPLVSAGWTDVFVARLSADGGHVWSQRHRQPRVVRPLRRQAQRRGCARMEPTRRRRRLAARPRDRGRRPGGRPARGGLRQRDQPRRRRPRGRRRLRPPPRQAERLGGCPRGRRGRSRDRRRPAPRGRSGCAPVRSPSARRLAADGHRRPDEGP